MEEEVTRKEGVWRMIRDLKYFLELTKHNNFSDAAVYLYTSQSNLSKRIQNLESSLDVVLYDRKKRQVTEAGAIFLEYAESTIDNYETMNEKLNVYRDKPVYIIDLAIIPVLNNFNLSKVISLFYKKYKNININIKVESQTNVENMLKSQKVDLAIIRKKREFSNYKKVRIGVEKIYMVCHKQHKLARRDQVTLEELAEENLLLFDESSVLYSLITNAFEAEGIKPNITHKIARVEIILTMVADNHGITFLTENNVKDLLGEDHVAIELKKPIKSEVILIRNTHQKQSPKIDTVFNFFQENYE